MRRFSALLAVLVSLCLLPGQLVASNQKPAKPQDHPIALIGATLHTVSGETIKDGVLLFEHGKITGLGVGIVVPDNTERINMIGMHVYPGLIAAHTNLGLIEIGSVRGTLDINEIGDITPSVRTLPAVNPDSELLPVTRANGVLMALVVPNGGLIAGISGLIMLDGWTWEEMTLKSAVGLHVWWPSMDHNRVQLTPTVEEQQKRIEGQIQAIRDAFRAARGYWVAKTAASAANAPYHDSDLSWEALIPVLKKEMSVFVHANDIKQIQTAIDWAADEGVRMVLVGGYDAWRVADRLKQHDIPVILDGTHRLPVREWEAYDTPFSSAAKLFQAGVAFCLSTGADNYNERNLPFQAATAAAYGLPKEEALKAVTLYPARILGVADRVGSLEVGKDATLIVTNGDPLEVVTQIERAYIGGRRVDLSSKHTDLYDKYQTKYDRETAQPK